MRSHTSLYDRYAKRLADVAIAAAALVVLLPVLALVAAAVLLTMGWPVLYSDQRAGLRGRPFAMKKFRTMTNACGPDGRLLADERRLTPLGRVLRQCSLDELPELFHVLTGEMSLVGPRPLPVRYLTRYTPEQARRLEVKPGVTGLAQARGRNSLSWPRKFALDVWYVDHRTARLDLWILAATVKVVVRGAGVSHPGQATMHEFFGPAVRPER